jgi:DNA-binding MarR family transcriptional regulator
MSVKEPGRMTGFHVDGSGLMVEEPVHELASWYAKFPHASDSLNYEAHVMLLRSFMSLTALTSGSGLSRARYNVLRILYQAPGHRLQMTDIGTGLGVSPTNVTKMVDSLERDGLVRRVRHDDDKRKTWTELTPEGELSFEQALPKVLEFTDGVWGELTEDEKRSLVHVLAKLRMVLMTRHTALPLTRRANEDFDFDGTT